MDLKKIVAECVNYQNKSANEIKNLITLAPSAQMGDYALPCFSFAKERKTAPNIIAKEIQENLNASEFIEKTEIVGGYLNFFLSKQKIAEQILKESENENFFVEKLETPKVVCIDYSSPNLAKYMHIGHYNSTILGEAIARLHEFMGYKVIRINYLGDYGTPFGKMVVGYMLWGNKEDVEKRGIDAIQELYVKFNQEENEELLEKAREASKKIEEKTGEEYEIYKWFINISVDKVKSIMKTLELDFDDWRGESTYNSHLKGVVEELVNKNIATRSEGALIVDLNHLGLGVAVVERKDGASLYITRDIAAVEDRFKLYNFDKMVYVTSIEQKNHFAKLIEICKLLNKPYAEKIQHVSYGLFSMPEGKISSRKGKQALIEGILAEAIAKAQEIIKDKTFQIEDPQNVAETIAKGAMAFSIFKVETIKDKIFDLKTAISFEGDTSPYIQYTYARCASLLRKRTSQEKELKDFSVFENVNAFNIMKEINNFKQVVLQAFNENEPSYIAKSLLEIVRQFGAFYNSNKIIGSADENEKLALVKLICKTLKIGLNLLCIKTLEEM